MLKRRWPSWNDRVKSSQVKLLSLPSLLVLLYVEANNNVGIWRKIWARHTYIHTKIFITYGLLLLAVTPLKVLVRFHSIIFFSFCLLVVAVVSVVRRVWLGALPPSLHEYEWFLFMNYVLYIQTDNLGVCINVCEYIYIHIYLCMYVYTYIWMFSIFNFA